jgi:hypothetical protein
MPGTLSVLFPQLSGDAKVELRELQDLPGLPNNVRSVCAWPGKFDQFATDRFLFRSKLINIASQAGYRIGLSISDEVIIGKNGWLFLRKDSDVMDEYRGIVQLSAAEIESWVRAFVARKREIEQGGAMVYFIIVPNKHTIYKEFLPDQYKVVGEGITDQIVNALRDEKVNEVIDQAFQGSTFTSFC